MLKRMSRISLQRRKGIFQSLLYPAHRRWRGRGWTSRTPPKPMSFFLLAASAAFLAIALAVALASFCPPGF